MSDEFDFDETKPAKKTVKAPVVKGRIGAGGQKVTIQGNLIQVPHGSEKALLGSVVPRSVLLDGAPLAHGMTAFSGTMGSGKSLTMGRQGRLWANAGAEIVTNSPGCGIPNAIVIPELADIAAWISHRIHTPWEDLSWAWIGLEELSLHAAGREWQKFPMEIAVAVVEQRKYKLAVSYTSTNWHNVDALLRQLTTWVWHCRMTQRARVWPFSRWTGGTIVAECRPPEWEAKDEDEKPAATIRWRPREKDLDSIPTGSRTRVLQDRVRDTERKILIEAADELKQVAAARKATAAWSAAEDKAAAEPTSFVLRSQADWLEADAHLKCTIAGLPWPPEKERQ